MIYVVLAPLSLIQNMQRFTSMYVSGGTSTEPLANLDLSSFYEFKSVDSGVDNIRCTNHFSSPNKSLIKFFRNANPNEATIF